MNITNHFITTTNIQAMKNCPQTFDAHCLWWSPYISKKEDQYISIIHLNRDGINVILTLDCRWCDCVCDYQGACGSCWAFSATGALEGQLGKNRKLISLSEQNLLDCDRRSHGCRGGLMGNAYNWMIQAGGINSEQTYPYTARVSLFSKHIKFYGVRL